MNIGRDKVWLMTIHHRDRTIAQAFRSEAGAMAWLRDRQAREHVVQWTKSELWLND